MNLRILAPAAVAAVALVPSAHGITRPLTTEPDVYVDYDVTITDSRITLSDHTADRGNGGAFHVKNVGTKAHNFAFVGRGLIGLSSAGLSTPVLRPGQTFVLQIYMDYRGTLTYRSTQRYDLNKIGMKGRFTVT
jgi:hypothetical protein